MNGGIYPYPERTGRDGGHQRQARRAARGDCYRQDYLRPETLAAIREGKVVKGNVLATARVAATLSKTNG